MELRGKRADVTVLDDFAHHPTAIRSTLAGLRAQLGDGRILAVLEPRSNTMRSGLHKEQLAEALSAADRVFLYASDELNWDADLALQALGDKRRVLRDVAAIVAQVVAEARPGDTILVMSNGGFAGIHQRLLDALAHREQNAKKS
jgi:UDP-N-acetylmuramate: L-alanyl-gamma-D-glutamyl-meso-diaminopimelate ligase